MGYLAGRGLTSQLRWQAEACPTSLVTIGRFRPWGGRVLIGFMPFTEIAALSADPDWRILGFTAATAILCGILFGLAPALQTTRPDLSSTLKEQAGAVVGSGGQIRLRKGPVVAQVALSLLLTGAGMFLRSLGKLKGVDLGFRADRRMPFTIQPALSGYTPPRAIALFDALPQRMAGMPGARSVAATQTPLLANKNWDMGITVPGYEPNENENAPDVTAVSPGYFAALGMPLAAGREFREGDNAAGPRVAVVNQTFAQVYFGGQNPIGRQFYFTADAQSGPADVREPRQRFVFCPYAQQYSANIGGMTYYVRTSQHPESLAAALRQAVREADANLPVYNLKTMERQIDEDVFADRMVSALSAFFGLLASVLAAIGLYGVMSYTVTRRTREIGIRMAGASRRDLLGIVLGEVVWLAATGIAIAAPLSFPLAVLAKSMLYGVAPHDVAALAGAVALLAVTALARVMSPQREPRGWTRRPRFATISVPGLALRDRAATLISTDVARVGSNRYPDIGGLAESLIMECEERARLAQDYFNALDHQRKITVELKLLAESGKLDLVKVAEIEAETAIEKAYDAWHAFNEHQSAHQCGA